MSDDDTCSSDTKRCELCREIVESYTLTSDSHPEGPNHVVGQCCVYTDTERGGDAGDE